MAKPDFQKVEQAFNAVAAARQGGEDPSVTMLCQGDAAVAAEVRALLGYATNPLRPQSDSTASAFLDPAELHGERTHRDDAGLFAEWGASAAGQRVGDFTLIAPVGMGGMGVVFVAEQEHPRRQVALKLIRRQAATQQMVRRFEREAHFLGRLNHPGIAQIYAAGVAELTGQAGLAPVHVPYLAMELIEGPTILDFVCGAGGAKPAGDQRQALRLIAQACEAVHHAHQRGVIHRDLKPANILVCKTPDGTPQVKVLDFGVARPAGDTEAGLNRLTENLTGEGFLVGTLAYMSPEQVHGREAVDVRSDVYALGVMLYQMLCCRLPVSVDDCPLPEAARRIADEQPARPSSVNRSLRGDVDTIIAKALEKDPARRYQSCAELARDLKHYLDGEPIEARRDSIAYVLGKRVVAYRRLAWTAALMVALSALFTIYAVRQQRVQKEVAAVATLARADADASAAVLARELSASRVEQGHLLGEAGELTSAERLLWDEYFGSDRREPATWALRELYARNGCVRTLHTHDGETRAVAVMADGKRLITGGSGADVHVWSIDGGERLATYPTGFGNTWSVAATRDGKVIVAGGDRGACLIDTAAGTRRPVVTGGNDVWGVAVSPDDTVVALGNRVGLVRLFDPRTGRMLLELDRRRRYDRNRDTAAPVRNVAFDPTGQHLAAIYDDGAIRVWELSVDADGISARAGAEFAGHARGTMGSGLAFNAYGTILASGGNDRQVKLWRVADGTELASCPTNNGTARTIHFSPDGRHAAVSGLWRTQILDVGVALRDGTAPMTPLGDNDGSYAAAYTPDGTRLLTGYTAGNVRVWDRTTSATVVMPGRDAQVCGLGVARVDGVCVVASAQENGDLIVRTSPWAGVREQAAWQVRTHANVADNARSLVLTPDGRTMVVGYADGHAAAVSAVDGRVEQELSGHRDQVVVMTLSADGLTLVTGGTDGRACVWHRQRATGRWEPGRVFECGGGVLGVAVDPAQRLLATSATDRSLRLWSIDTGQLLGQWVEPRTPWRLTFAPDGRRLASGMWDRSVRVWDVVTEPDRDPVARPHLRLNGHAQLASGQTFDASGRFLASTSNDGTLRLWDVSSAPSFAALHADDRRRCLATFDAKAGDAYAGAFLPVRSDVVPPIVVGYADGSVRIWDPAVYEHNLAGQLAYQQALRKAPAK